LACEKWKTIDAEEIMRDAEEQGGHDMYGWQKNTGLQWIAMKTA